MHNLRPAVALLLLPVVAACSAATGSGPRVSDAKQVSVEFSGESRNLSLAPTASWPDRYTVPSTGPDGAKQVYQVGYGRVEADAYWYCSWEKYLLSQPSGSSEAKKATEALRQVRHTFMYKTALEGRDRDHFDRTLDSALGGDRELMRLDVLAACQRPQE